MKSRSILFATTSALTIMALSFGFSRGNSTPVDPATFPAPAVDLASNDTHPSPQKIVLAGGCFWCTEAVFENTPGVVDVVSGYAGGTPETANYKDVSNGLSQHAEVIEVTFNPKEISVGKVLQIFFSIAHDPTTLNRQGPDSGAQYRSAIFFSDPEHARVAKAYIAQLDAAKVFESPIVTTVEPLEKFFAAEGYHQDYARLNPSQPYVRQQALPKVAKAQKYVPEILATTQPTTQPSTKPAIKPVE